MSEPESTPKQLASWAKKSDLHVEYDRLRAELLRAQQGWTRALDELEKADAWVSRLQTELAELKDRTWPR